MTHKEFVQLLVSYLERTIRHRTYRICVDSTMIDVATYMTKAEDVFHWRSDSHQHFDCPDLDFWVLVHQNPHAKHSDAGSPVGIHYYPGSCGIHLTQVSFSSQIGLWLRSLFSLTSLS